MRRAFLTVLLAALCATAWAVPEDDALERGLAAIRRENIGADVFFLADDAMRGRDTPSPEQRVAARYIRSRLERLGFTPGGDDGSFFHDYELDVQQIDAGASHVVLAGKDGERRLTFGADYYFGSSLEVDDLSVDADVVFCGSGKRRDFEAVGADKLRGRWAFCLDEGGLTIRRRNLALDEGGLTIRRRNLAREHGAVGILVTPGPDYKKDPYPERHARATADLLAGRVLRSFGPRGGGKKRDVFPQVFLAPESSAGLAAGAAVGDVLGFRVREERRALRKISLENVCGLWPGTDRADEVILVSAHYDHVGTQGDDVYNGADDNASGSTGLLALAEALAERGPLRRSVLLIWVSGEEKGLLGSKAWATDPTLPAGARAVCNINIDMIGRNAPERLGITPTEGHRSHNGLTRLAQELAPLEGFGKLQSADAYYHRSDQAEFARLDIPVCFLFSFEHADYHRPGDTPDKIDQDKIRRVVRLVFRMIDRLQGDTLEL